jgi:hypothetical protein
MKPPVALTLGYILMLVYVVLIAAVGVTAGAYAIGFAQLAVPVLVIGLAAVVWKGSGVSRAEHFFAAGVAAFPVLAILAVVMLVGLTGPHLVEDRSGTHWVWISGH